VLKPLDFSKPALNDMIRGPKRPQGKKEIFDLQMEKLRIMLHFYDQNDFQRVKFFRLNSD
jgi:hypothetical protein